jgi:hypothetical protein
MFFTCFPITAGSTTIVLESGDLPYTTVQDGDILQISGSEITSATNGIHIQHNNITLDFGSDVLKFGADGSNNRWGIKLGQNDPVATWINGGTIHHLDTTDASTGCNCILIESCDSLYMDGTKLIKRGTDSRV